MKLKLKKNKENKSPYSDALRRLSRHDLLLLGNVSHFYFFLPILGCGSFWNDTGAMGTEMGYQSQ